MHSPSCPPLPLTSPPRCLPWTSIASFCANEEKSNTLSDAAVAYGAPPALPYPGPFSKTNIWLSTTGLWSQVQNRPASVLVFPDKLSFALFVLLWLNQFLISQLSWVIQKCDDPQHFPCLPLQAGSFQRAWERRQRHLFRSVKKFKFSSKRLLESLRPTAEQTTLYPHDGYKGAVINWAL